MKQLLIVILVLYSQFSAAQYSKHIIQLSDKNNSPYSINHPSAYLSAKAIERRERQQISIDSTDLPVNPAYIESIINAGTVTVLNTSRWLNYVLIETTDAEALDKINNFPFVRSVTRAALRKRASKTDKYVTEVRPSGKRQQLQEAGDHFDYGANYNQVNIHEGEFLHNNGFRGEGMIIAMLDAGYYRYDTNPAFDSIRLHNQVLGTWDFVKNKASVTEEHSHGMICFSTIAANRPGKIVGTAPKAQYYLFRTEDAATEYQIEEQNWVAAAERADSLGADLITSSLGYYEFDDAASSYSYSDMDGKTAIITRGAEMAFKKGIIVTNSAGNSGTSAWHYIIAPADGEHVLAIGATDASGVPAAFSSYGPSADGRIKPDVASVGAGTVVAGLDGNPAYANGTSVANPNLAGLITCLWQAFPQMTNREIVAAVKKSASQYQYPDDRTGYGIPNMRAAYEILSGEALEIKTRKILGEDWIKAYPVPFSGALTVLVKPETSGNATLTLLNSVGKEVFRKKIQVSAGISYYEYLSNLTTLSQGVYWLRYSDGKNTRVLRLVK
ncbi:MAG: S8 family serine peptidase [Chitinophagaceae bacterium]|nr:S8 family serine peptidase [Chitinophagaceae bacterium]MCW5925323.1 S8 family serine peptidase [Chitinophagaceae bacterium]